MFADTSTPIRPDFRPGLFARVTLALTERRRRRALQPVPAQRWDEFVLGPETAVWPPEVPVWDAPRHWLR